MTDFDITQPYRYRNGEEVFRTLATDLPGAWSTATCTSDSRIFRHGIGGATSIGFDDYDLVNIPAPKPVLPWPLFRPAIGDDYFSIDVDRAIVIKLVWCDGEYDLRRASLNLVFPTEAAATAHLQRMLDEAEIRRIVAEHNGDWVWVPGETAQELNFNHHHKEFYLHEVENLMGTNPVLVNPMLPTSNVRSAILSAIPLDRVARVFGGV